MKLYILKKNTLLTLALSLLLIQPQAHAISLNSLGATLSQNKTAACLIGGLVVASTALGFYAYKKSCALQKVEQELTDAQSTINDRVATIVDQDAHLKRLEQEKAALDAAKYALEKADVEKEVAHAQAIESWRNAWRDVDQSRQRNVANLNSILEEYKKNNAQLKQTNSDDKALINLLQAELGRLSVQCEQAHAKNGQLAKSLETANVIKQAIELIERHNKNLKDMSPKKLQDTKKAIEQELTEIDALIAQTQALAGTTINIQASSGADIKHSAESHATISAPIAPVVNVITRLQEHKEKILKLQKIVLAEEQTIEAEQVKEQTEKQAREKEDKDRQDAALQLTAIRKAYQEQKAKEEQIRVAQEKQAKDTAMKEQARKAIPAYQHRAGDTSANQKPIPSQQKMKLKRTLQKLKSQDAAAEKQKTASNGSAATSLSTWLWSWFNVTGKKNN